jgi:protein-S-isoprenylcysteine O-methyltransferase Ste14
MFLFGVDLVAHSCSALLLLAFFATVLVAYVPLAERHPVSISREAYREYQERSHLYLRLPIHDEAG